MLCALCAGAAPPPPVQLSGRVVDRVSGDPVADAVIRLERAGVEVRSDEDGRFDFPDRDVVSDSLTVRGLGYESMHVLLGEHSEAEVSLNLRLEPLAPELDPSGTLIVEEALLALQGMWGGTAWRHRDFWRSVARAGHPLDLLLPSGLVSELVPRSEQTRCVILAGAEGCATIWLNGDPSTDRALDSYFPGQIIAFLVLPPGAGSGREEVGAEGTVVVFTNPGAP